MRHSVLVVAFVVLTGMVRSACAEGALSSIGVLTCTLTDDASDKVSKVSCGFKSATSATEEKYEGIVRGLARVNAGKQVLMWSVLAPAGTQRSAGLLAQNYSRAKQPGHPPSWTGDKNSGVALIFETHGDSELGSAITEIELEVATTPA